MECLVSRCGSRDGKVNWLLYLVVLRVSSLRSFYPTLRRPCGLPKRVSDPTLQVSIPVITSVSKLSIKTSGFKVNIHPVFHVFLLGTVTTSTPTRTQVLTLTLHPSFHLFLWVTEIWDRGSRWPSVSPSLGCYRPVLVLYLLLRLPTKSPSSHCPYKSASFS